MHICAIIVTDIHCYLESTEDMNELHYNYIAVNVICVLSLYIVMHASRHNVLLTHEMKRYFSLAASITILVTATEIGSVFFENAAIVNSVLVYIVNMIGFSLSPFIAILLSKAYPVTTGKVRALLTIPAWINLALVISTPWTGLIFSVNESIYMRGPWFGLYILTYMCTYLALILESFNAMKHYQCHTKSTFILLIAFALTGTFVQIILPKIHTTWACITLSLILYYVYFCELSETQDSLSGLLNRNVYDQHIRKLNRQSNGSVIVFDMDDFKQINDMYGHPWGDSCLQIIGKLIRDCFLHIGFCYRVGGDEFCVICRTTNEQQIKDAIGLFHLKIDEIRKSSNTQSVLPMVSTGYSVFQGSQKEYAAAMAEADAQMYYFKNSRKQTIDI